MCVQRCRATRLPLQGTPDLLWLIRDCSDAACWLSATTCCNLFTRASTCCRSTRIRVKSKISSPAIFPTRTQKRAPTSARYISPVRPAALLQLPPPVPAESRTCVLVTGVQVLCAACDCFAWIFRPGFILIVLSMRSTAVQARAPAFTEAQSFDGPAPETINVSLSPLTIVFCAHHYAHLHNHSVKAHITSQASCICCGFDPGAICCKYEAKCSIQTC